MNCQEKLRRILAESDVLPEDPANGITAAEFAIRVRPVLEERFPDGPNYQDVTLKQAISKLVTEPPPAVAMGESGYYRVATLATNRPNHAAPLPHRLTASTRRRLRGEVRPIDDMPTTHVTIGANEDFDAYLAENLGGGPAGEWPVKTSAKIGDRVAILIPALHGDFRAFGTVASLPRPGKWGNSSRHFASVDDLHEISPQVPIAAVRNAFPQWKWANYARIYTTVPAEILGEFWRLLENPPIAGDNAPPPDRIATVVSRIVRDTAATNALKAKYDFKCQVCGVTLPFGSNEQYIEVHHLRPLGHPHDGPDLESNMIVLCPNHHALFDLGVPRFLTSSLLQINDNQFTLTVKHKISTENVAYYATHVQR